jgi:hypothetical protein
MGAAHLPEVTVGGSVTCAVPMGRRGLPGSSVTVARVMSSREPALTSKSRASSWTGRLLDTACFAPTHGVFAPEEEGS